MWNIVSSSQLKINISGAFYMVAGLQLHRSLFISLDHLSRFIWSFPGATSGSKICYSWSSVFRFASYTMHSWRQYASFNLALLSYAFNNFISPLYTNNGYEIIPLPLLAPLIQPFFLKVLQSPAGSSLFDRLHLLEIHVVIILSLKEKEENLSHSNPSDFKVDSRIMR